MIVPSRAPLARCARPWAAARPRASRSTTPRRSTSRPWTAPRWRILPEPTRARSCGRSTRRSVRARISACRGWDRADWGRAEGRFCAVIDFITGFNLLPATGEFGYDPLPCLPASRWPRRRPNDRSSRSTPTPRRARGDGLQPRPRRPGRAGAGLHHGQPAGRVVSAPRSTRASARSTRRRSTSTLVPERGRARAGRGELAGLGLTQLSRGRAAPRS